MNWVKIDVGFFRHHKSIKAGRDARLLYLASICYCGGGLTDGFVPDGALPLLGAEAGIPKPQICASTLVEVGLWHQCEGGYQVHNYLEWNPSSESVRAKREAASDRMKRARSQDVRANKPRTSREVRQLDTDTDTDNKQEEGKRARKPDPVDDAVLVDRYQRQTAVFEAYAAAAGLKTRSHEWRRKMTEAMIVLAEADGSGTMPDPECMALMTGYVRAQWLDLGNSTTPSLIKVLEHQSGFETWHDAWISAGKPLGQITDDGTEVPDFLLLRNLAKRSTGNGRKDGGLTAQEIYERSLQFREEEHGQDNGSAVALVLGG